MRYVLAYYGGKMAETEAEQAAVMRAWGSWFGQVGSAMVDPGRPYSGAANSIASNGTVTGGPIGERSTGYSILEADSLDAATELAKGCPLLQSEGQIAVYETHDMM